MLRYKNYIFCFLFLVCGCEVVASLQDGVEDSENPEEIVDNEKNIGLQNYWNQNQGDMQIPTAPILKEDGDSENLNNLNQNNQINTTIFNQNIETSEQNLRDTKYAGSLNLNLGVSGSGNIKNTEQSFLYCNKIIMNSGISGSGKIKIFKKKNDLFNILPSAKVEKISRMISGSNSEKIVTSSSFYDTITCDAVVFGSGNIKLYIACNEIEWKKTSVSGSGGVYLDYKLIASNQNKENTVKNYNNNRNGPIIYNEGKGAVYNHTSGSHIIYNTGNGHVMQGPVTYIENRNGNGTSIRNENNNSIINSFNNNNNKSSWNFCSPHTTFGDIIYVKNGEFRSLMFIAGSIIIGIPVGLLIFKHRHYKDLGFVEFISELYKIIKNN